MTIVKRIKEYIDSCGISISFFEKSIGMSNATFRKAFQSNGAIGSDKVERIIKKYTDINPEWLLTGIGPMKRPAPFIDYSDKAIAPLAMACDRHGNYLNEDKAVTAAPDVSRPERIRCNSRTTMKLLNMQPVESTEIFEVKDSLGSDFVTTGDLLLVRSTPEPGDFTDDRPYVIEYESESGPVVKIGYARRSERNPDNVAIRSGKSSTPYMEVPKSRIKVAGEIQKCYKLSDLG